MGVLNIDYTFSEDEVSRSWNVPVSGKYMFYAVGDFVDAVLSLEASPDNGVNWFTVDQLEEPGRLIRYLVSGEKVRLSLTNSTSPDITAGIRQ